jgi:protein-L-isoaspartate O-methyltransferase
MLYFFPMRKTMKNTILISCALLLGIAAAMASRAFAETISYQDLRQKYARGVATPQDYVLLNKDPKRYVILPPKRIVDFLKIRPGMVIADVGAGTGFFTYPMADALKGSGQIYATETARLLEGYLVGKTATSGYKNVFPVLVSPDGVDPFYKQHVFDLIFLGEVYHILVDPVAYFDELRPSLKKETGRLCIIEAKPVPDFTPIECDDFRRTMRVLVAKGERFPVRRRLSPEVEAWVKNWKDQDVPNEMRVKIVRDINAMLMDRNLFPELNNFYGARGVIGFGKEELLGPEDRRLTQGLIIFLDAVGVFSSTRELSLLESKELHALNRLLLTRLLWGGAPFPNLYVDWKIVEKESIVRSLEQAGYELVDATDLLNYHYILQFKRAR